MNSFMEIQSTCRQNVLESLQESKKAEKISGSGRMLHDCGLQSSRTHWVRDAPRKWAWSEIGPFRRTGLARNRGKPPPLRLFTGLEGMARVLPTAQARSILTYVPYMGHNKGNGLTLSHDLRALEFYDPVLRDLRDWPSEARRELGSLLLRLQRGEVIGMPDARGMPTIGKGVFEIRIRSGSGAFRVFCVVIERRGILVFHAYHKKTRKLPVSEARVARVRYKALTCQ